jgi:hemoglobin
MILEKEITEKNIKFFVNKFYAKVLKDEEVGPFFIELLGTNMENEKWQEHIEVLCNFWASVTLGHKTYRGSPFAPHRNFQGLKRETFYRWLELFFETLEEIYEHEITLVFKETGSIMAQNFMRNLRL